MDEQLQSVNLISHLRRLDNGLIKSFQDRESINSQEKENMTHVLSCMVIGPGSRSSCGQVRLILDPCSFMQLALQCYMLGLIAYFQNLQSGLATFVQLFGQMYLNWTGPCIISNPSKSPKGIFSSSHNFKETLLNAFFFPHIYIKADHT